MNSIFVQNIRIAIAALKRNRLRTILSLLGMAIGIMSIVIIMSAGKSLRLVLLSQLEAFGTDGIVIEVKIPNTRANSTDNAGGMAQGISVTTLGEEDKQDIDKIPAIKQSYAAVMGQAIAISAYNEKRTNYFAVSPEFDLIDSAEVVSGRFYDSEDERGLAKYIVLGSDIARTLFPNQNPIGQTIKLQKVNFTVIGVFKERGSTGFLNMDELIFVPLHTAQKLLLGFDHVSFIMAQMHDANDSATTADSIKDILRTNHNITDPTKDDFSVTTQEESLAIIGTILNGMTMVLTIIAAVALIVGGVGIMNIMYVAVNERVFEIGLRKAFGARQKTIRWQFLVESIVITCLGGFLGIILALCAIYLIHISATYAGFDWPLALSFESLLLSLCFSSAIGISFGYFPAKKASQLNPIEALQRNIF